MTFHKRSRSSTDRDRIRSRGFAFWDTAQMPDEPRFLTLADVAEILNVSAAQVYALVRNGKLPSIKVGGKGEYRVERDRLEAYIQQLYAETEDFIKTHPFTRDDEEEIDPQA
jgi:excisionase family DNA binding protein